MSSATLILRAGGCFLFEAYCNGIVYVVLCRVSEMFDFVTVLCSDVYNAVCDVCKCDLL